MYAAYLRGECNPCEAQILSTIMPELIERELISFEDVGKMVGNKFQLDGKRTEEIFERIISHDPTVVSLWAKLNKQLPKWMGILVLLLPAVCYICYQLFFASGHFKEQVFANRSQFVKTVKLLDGTKVFLAEGTQLVQLSDFEEDSLRRVRLRGRAFFEVAKDPAKAFVVESATNLEVRVLGTAFNLVDLPGKGELVLTRGKVRVQKGGTKTFVAPGQKVTVDPDGGLSVNLVDTTSYSSWRTGMKYFNGITLDSLVADLNEHYGGHLELDPAFVKRAYSGYLPVNDVERTLNIINSTFNKIIIYKK